MKSERRKLDQKWFQPDEEKARKEHNLAMAEAAQFQVAHEAKTQRQQPINGDRELAVKLQLEEYRSAGKNQADDVADLKNQQDADSLATRIQKRELERYEQEQRDREFAQQLQEEENKRVRGPRSR